MKTFAIILAAGRGSRMKGLTADQPKCMLQLAGRPLLRWQEESLQEAGISDIHVVKGYKGECFPERFSFSVNPRWAETNMLFSLACASGYIEAMFGQGYGQFIISYSDIVYAADHVRKLMASEADIAITYDLQWEKLWSLRFQDVLADAETFVEKNGELREIGGRAAAISDIAGQYMGLLKMTRNGWDEWRAEVANLGIALDTTDMTSFLRHLLAEKHRIAAVPVQGRWCEADSSSDLAAYENALASGLWSHDWRGEASK